MTLKKAALLACAALRGWHSFGVEPPTTVDAVQAVIERSKQNPNVLLELKGAPLDILIRELRPLWTRGEATVEGWMKARQTGHEKEFLEMEASVQRDPKYFAEVYPLARDILINHPDFEWTIRAKLERMSYILNEAERKRLNGQHPGAGYAQTNTDYKAELYFASRIPGDAAFRIIGPFLNSPYYPELDFGDVKESSPAARAQVTLARLLKERYGEDLPNEIEAARAWWKGNENRFAEKETEAPRSLDTSKNAQKKDSPTNSQGDAVSSQATGFRPAPEVTSRKIRWSISIVIVTALLAAAIWLLRARQ